MNFKALILLSLCLASATLAASNVNGPPSFYESIGLQISQSLFEEIEPKLLPKIEIVKKHLKKPETNSSASETILKKNEVYDYIVNSNNFDFIDQRKREVFANATSNLSPGKTANLLIDAKGGAFPERFIYSPYYLAAYANHKDEVILRQESYNYYIYPKEGKKFPSGITRETIYLISDYQNLLFQKDFIEEIKKLVEASKNNPTESFPSKTRLFKRN